PSIQYFYHEQRRLGARVEVVATPDQIRIDLDKLLAAIDETTLLVQINANLVRSEEHTSELQSLAYLVCRLLLEKKKLHLRFDGAIDPNLAFQQFRHSRHFQRFDLLDFRGMKIDAARGVSLPDAQLVNGQFLNVKEHVFSASGAYAFFLQLSTPPAINTLSLHDALPI